MLYYTTCNLFPIINRVWKNLESFNSIFYILWFQLGDNEDEADSTLLATDQLLPQRVIDQYEMTAQMWAERIETCQQEHKGLVR